MVPAAWVDALPLTTHGKVDRRALPAPREASRGAREMAAMLDELKGLSPEEIRALLEAEG